MHVSTAIEDDCADNEILSESSPQVTELGVIYKLTQFRLFRLPQRTVYSLRAQCLLASVWIRLNFC